MKKRNSKIKTVGALVTIVLVSIVFAQCNKPASSYTQSAESILKMIDSTDYIVSLDLVKNEDFALIDIRSPIEYEKGHMEGAVNVYSPELLEKDKQLTLNELRADGRRLLVYGNEPAETLPAFMTLSQLDMGPVKVLKTRNYFEKDRFITVPVDIENPTDDIDMFIRKSVEEVAQLRKTQITKKSTPPPPKKVAPKKKKKKKMPEGGC